MSRLRHIALVFLCICWPLQVSAKSLIPMGDSIGIQLELPFVYVSHDILLTNGEWLRQGDKILQQNGQAVNDIEQLEATTESTQLQIERAGKEKMLTVTAEEIAQFLPFLKDETDGIGTLTFIDPETNEYGALGHQIIDQTLKAAPSFSQGSIFQASISQIKKSEPGQPGYKISVIDPEQAPLGNVLHNNVYGVFGEWQSSLQQSVRQPLEIMHPTDIQTGEAHILTAIEQEKVEKFSIDIREIDGSNLIFIVTDQRLLEKTGGILQGMSGSPIIQHDQFVGAVTHMFVEEPTKGAALSMEEMLKKAP